MTTNIDNLDLVEGIDNENLTDLYDGDEVQDPSLNDEDYKDTKDDSDLDDKESDEDKSDQPDDVGEDDNLDEELNEEEFQGDKSYKTNYGHTNEEWKEIVKKLNMERKTPEYKEAAADVCESLSKVITSLLWKYHPTYCNMYKEDMINEGYVAVLTVMKKYDPDRGKAITWCQREIRGRWRSFISEVGHSTPHYQKRNKKLADIIEAHKRYGGQFSIEDVAIEANVSVHEVNKCLVAIKRSTSSVSMEQLKGGDNTITVGESLMSSIDTPEEAFIKDEATTYMHDIIDQLPVEDRQVLVLSFGLGGRQDMSNKEIAASLHMQEQDVRSHLSNAINLMRKKINFDGTFKGERMQRSFTKQPAAMSLPRTVEDLSEELDSFDFSNFEE